MAGPVHFTMERLYNAAIASCMTSKILNPRAGMALFPTAGQRAEGLEAEPETCSRVGSTP